MGINPSKFLKFSALLLDLDNLPDIFQFLLNLHLAYDLKGRFRAHKQKPHSKDLKTHYYDSSKQNNFSRLWMKNLFVTIQLYGNDSNSQFYYTILKSLVVLVIWLAVIGAIYSRIAPFFALNRIFFPANEEATLKTKQPIRFQGFLKVTNQLQENERQRVPCDKFCNFCFPNSYFFPPKIESI